jgi:hypothetical protein
MSMNLNWIKCVGDQWCDFLKVNLTHNHFNDLEGVYIIWHGAPNPSTVRVGQGNIRERVTAHRLDPEILKYTETYSLYITWARVDFASKDGVENYLFNKLKPRLGERCPDCEAISVNLPWSS